MIVEVIAVGTELLLGEIVNTNAAEIGVRLAEDGFDVHYQVTVGDNMDRLVEAMRSGCKRADAIILTGGIGPTQDDLTRDAISVLLGVGIARDEDHARVITERLAARGVIADTALRMADYPEGTEPLPNRKGVALGIAAVHDGVHIYSVPGVPSEMRVMIDDEVRPRLRAISGEPAVISSRLLHTWGFGESQIAEMLDDLYETTNPSVAFLINGPEVRVRISAKASSLDQTSWMIEGVESDIRARLGDAVFAVDDQTVDAIISDRLKTKGWTVAVVEMSTAGWLSARLARDEAFVGGSVLVESSAEAVDEQALALLGLETVPQADVVVAVSGASGTSTGDGTAARRVSVAVRTPHATTTRTINVLGDDERVRQFAASGALHVLRLAL